MKKYIAIIIISSLMTSCLDALDQAPDGKLSMGETWADADMVEQMLSACYNNIARKGYSYWWYDPLVVACSDDGWSSEDGAGQPLDYMYRGSSSAAWHYIRDVNDGHGGLNNESWARSWAQIRLCTQFIENIDEAAVSSEANRARFKAEAHLLRAFFYMELVKWYGKLPVIDKTIAFDADYSEMRRQPVYEVAQLIISDCDVAIGTTELPWRIAVSSDALRMNKALAHALKTKALLFAASPLHNEGDNYWEEAYQAGKTAVQQLKSNGYGLFTSCTNTAVFGTHKAAALHQLVCENADISASPRDRETIFQHNAGGFPIWYHGYIGSEETGTYKCGTCPTQELMDAFETEDGVPVLNLANPYLDERHEQPNYNSANTMYNPNAPYENRDPRFYITALFHGSQFEWNNGVIKTVTATPGGQHAPSFVATDRNHSRTGYYQKKMVTPGACQTRQISNSNWKYYRLGELLLDYAEAAAEAGHLAEAIEAVDEVRARSGMPALPASLQQNELILRIRNERRVELAWEETRYFDLRRWQSPSGDLSATCKYFTAMTVTVGGDGTLIYTRRPISDNPRGGYENKDLLLPLPLDEANNMEAVTGVKWQNPGW